MLPLLPAEQRALRARAHHLRPAVIVGDAGLTAPVLKEIDLALEHHELVKLRVLGGDRGDRKRLIGELCAALAALPVQQIGRMLVIYRPRPAAATPSPGGS
jgi:putative YhbY family RNA-binding protein